MLLSYLFRGWCYFKADEGKITLGIEKKMRGREDGGLKGAGDGDRTSLQWDLISCVQQMTQYFDMVPVTASINGLEQFLLWPQCPNNKVFHTYWFNTARTFHNIQVLQGFGIARTSIKHIFTDIDLDNCSHPPPMG